MKSAELYYSARAIRPALPFPNAATRREILRKIVDFLLIVASSAGIVAIMVFLTAFA